MSHKAHTPPEKMNTLCRIRCSMRDIMESMGLDPSTEPGIIETPDRVARFFMEFSQPCDLVALLKAFDYDQPSEGQPMVVVKDIPLAALCEHHFAPFWGKAHIGYIPGKRVLGLSKFARLVDAAGHQRPSIQERLTNEIADALDRAIDPKGIIVVLSAEHSCMTCRGVGTPGVTTTTSTIRGAFVHSTQARQEFFELLRV